MVKYNAKKAKPNRANVLRAFALFGILIAMATTIGVKILTSRYQSVSFDAPPVKQSQLFVNEEPEESVPPAPSGLPVTPTPSVKVPTPIPTKTIPVSMIFVSASNPLGGQSFFINPNGSAPKSLATLSNESDKALINKIASQPIATWIVSNTSMDTVRNIAGSASSSSRVPIFVLYNVPNIGNCTDSGGGGAASLQAYKAWIDGIASSVGDSKVVIVLEPDSLMCQTLSDTRKKALSYAVDVLTAKKNIVLYVDAGHNNWINTSMVLNNLNAIGITKTRGISVNVSNYQTDEMSASYARQILQKLGGGGAIIDTSRNGVGPSPDHQWCNAPDRKLGRVPQPSNDDKIDAYLWIKYPGESDGNWSNCSNSPVSEGEWWLEYALGLARQ